MSLPSCLTMVNRVLEECGDVTVPSLDPGTRNSKIALEALNDVTADIWKRQRWPFQKQTSTFSLVANQADYALPDRFGRLAEPIRITSTTSGYTNLVELTPEVWNQVNRGGITLGTSPAWFKIDNTTLSLFPSPSSDFVTQYPTLTYAYFQDVPDRKTVSNDNDSWDLTNDFYEAMVLFGKAKLKQYLSFPDFGADMEAYERNLRQLQAKVREGRTPAQVRPRFWVVSEW